MKRIEQTLLFLTILLLPTQLGRHFWPEFSFVYSLPIDYLSPTLYFWDPLVILLFIVFIMQSKHINRAALNLFYFFILTQTLSLLSGIADPGVGFVRLEQYLIAGLFGVYIASSKLSEIKVNIFWALILSVSAEAILAILQFIKGGTLGFWILGERSFSITTPGIAKFDFYGREFLRPYATFPHPNTMAGFLVVTTILIQWLNRSSIWLFSGLVVLLTVSRGAITAGFISAFLLLEKRGRILLLGLLIISFPILYTRFSTVFTFDSLSLIRRGELSEVAFKIWQSSPILGVGLNNFILKASDEIVAGPSRFLQPAHNIFLLSLAETGILGLLGLLALIGLPVVRFFKLYPKPYSSSSLSGLRAEGLHSLLIAWGVVIFLGMFDHYFLTLPQGYRLLFLLWGLSLSMLEYKGA